MLKRRKKQEVIPEWEREAEYMLLYSKMAEAKAKYLTYEGDDETERARLKAEWLELEKVYTPLYQMKQEWMDKSNCRPRIEEKDKLSKSAILMAVMTAFGIVAQPIMENRGVILKTGKDFVSRAWNGMTSFFGLGKKR